MPPELEGLANITNPKTRRPYRIDVQEFSAFASLGGPAALRSVGRAYVSPGAKTSRPGGLSPSSIRRKLSALSSLFDYLCERNAVSGNPVDGVKRPMANGNEGSTQALGDAPARKLLEAPPGDTLKGVRDRAILAPCSITACAARSCAGCGSGTCRAARGVMHFRVRGKRGKTRFVPVHAMAQRLIEEYLAGHGADAAGPVFRPVTNNRKGEVDRALDRSTTTSC